MGRGLRIAGILAAAAALAAMAPAAGAAKGKGKGKGKKKPAKIVRSIATATGSTSGHTETQTVTATCPKGQIATGGGYDTPVQLQNGAPAGSNFAFISKRSGSSAWTISVFHITSDGQPGPPQAYTAYANCRTPAYLKKAKPKKRKKGKKSRPKKVPIVITETSGQGTATTGQPPATTVAACPPGQRPVGGGFETSPPTLTPNGIPAAYRNMSTGSGWQVSALAFGDPGLQLSVKSYAYCAPRVALTETQASASLPASQTGPGGFVLGQGYATTASCPKGTSLASGGFDGPDPGINMNTSAILVPLASAPSGSGWRAGGGNQGLAPGSLTAKAYCL